MGKDFNEGGRGRGGRGGGRGGSFRGGRGGGGGFRGGRGGGMGGGGFNNFGPPQSLIGTIIYLRIYFHNHHFKAIYSPPPSFFP